MRTVKPEENTMKILIWTITLLLARVSIGAAEESWFNLSFPGGTPREFAEAINKAAETSIRDPKPVHLLVPKDLPHVKLPPMELRAVRVGALFESLMRLYRTSPDGLEWSSSGENIW